MRKIELLAVALLATSIAGCIGMAGESVTQPTWEAGYRFQYVHTGTMEVENRESGAVEERTTAEFGPTRVVQEIVNTSMEADGDPVYVGLAIPEERTAIGEGAGSGAHAPEAPDVTWSSDREIFALRQRDLAAVPADIASATRCRGETCREGGALLLGSPPDYTRLDFPLWTGKRWEGTAETAAEGDLPGGTVGDRPIEYRIQAHVKGREQVEVPVGTVDAWRVDFTLTPADPGALEDRLRDSLESAGGEVDSVDVRSRAEETVYYGPAEQAIVRSAESLHQEIRLEGTAPDGERVDLDVRMDAGLTSELEGVALIPGPERTEEEIKRLRSDRQFDSVAVQGRKDPSTPDGYAIDVEPEGGTVLNAADAESTTFRAVRVDGKALPDGHEIRWERVRGEETVDTAAGAEYEVAPDRPGRYRIQATAVDGRGETVSKAEDEVVANWIATIDADCPPASASPTEVAGNIGNVEERDGPLPCPAADLPVGPDLTWMEVAARPTGAGETFDSRLEIRDADGGTVKSTEGPFLGDEEQEITLLASELVHETLDAGDWTARWHSGASAAQDVRYNVTMRFFRSPVPTPPERDPGPDARSSRTFDASDVPALDIPAAWPT